VPNKSYDYQNINDHVVTLDFSIYLVNQFCSYAITEDPIKSDNFK